MTRGQTWLAVVVLGIGGVIAAVVGLFTYMIATSRPLHPSAQDAPSVAAAAPSARWAGAVAKAQELVRADLLAQNLPGLSVAVGVDGEVVWAEGFGYANLESRSPVDPKTRFRAGGTSIALTSAAVGLLLERKRINLDEKIQRYVPSFPEKQWPVTLRQLMAHVAGISGDGGDEEPLRELCYQTTDGLQRFADRALRFEPGTRYQYSTYGWILVSAAVDAAANEPFFTFMRTQIFDRLGMQHTTVDSTSDPPRDRATLYYPRFAADNRYGPDLAREGDYSCFAGAGGFLTTPADLVRYGMAVAGGKLLEAGTVALLQSPQRLTSGEATGYGLGWDLDAATLAGAQTTAVGHEGEFFIGGSSVLTTFPERRMVVAVMTNTSFARTSPLAVSVAGAFAERAASSAGK